MQNLPRSCRCGAPEATSWGRLGLAAENGFRPHPSAAPSPLRTAPSDRCRMTTYSWLQMIRLLDGKEPGSPHIPETDGLEPHLLSDTLRRALAGGVAAILGVPVYGHIHEPIPAEAWHRIRIDLRSAPPYSSQGVPFGIAAISPAATAGEFRDGTGWYDLKISATELEKLIADHDFTVGMLGIAAGDRAMAITHQLLTAIGEDVDFTFWRTCIPKASRPPWTPFYLARAMVVKASEYDEDAAAEWLMMHAMSPVTNGIATGVQTRFKPSALAELEQQSVRERYRKQFPGLTANHSGLDDMRIEYHPGCCHWHAPLLTFSSDDREIGLTFDQVEWHGEELRTVLDQEFGWSREGVLVPNTFSDVLIPTLNPAIAQLKSDEHQTVAKLTASAEAKCKNWLIDLMNKHPENPIPQKTVKQRAKTKFPGLSDRAFTRAWFAAIDQTGASTWSKPGQRSAALKSNHDAILGQS